MKPLTRNAVWQAIERILNDPCEHGREPGANGCEVCIAEILDPALRKVREDAIEACEGIADGHERRARELGLAPGVIREARLIGKGIHALKAVDDA